MKIKIVKKWHTISKKSTILCIFCQKGFLYHRKIYFTRSGNKRKMPLISYLCSFCGKYFNQNQIEKGKKN